MSLFKFNFDDKIYIILIASFLWGLNFRSTFKNISSSMGLGSCWVLRFDPMLILIKNIICIFYFIAFIHEVKSSKAKYVKQKIISTHALKNKIKVEYNELKIGGETILNTIDEVNYLDKLHLKILFWMKIILLILVIYIIEELYFLLSNNHVIDRVICPIRNCGILLALFIFSPLFLKKPCSYNKHQLIPFIIIFVLSIIIILLNVFGVDRFLKKFNPVNSSIYYSLYFLMGLEIVLIKYLTDHQYISIFFILGMKGIIGTIIMAGINIAYNKREIYAFLDNILTFEYDDMLDNFEFIYKFIYIITLVILQWMKIYIINKFSENHLQMILMMVDLIYYPFYCIERYIIQKFVLSGLLDYISIGVILTNGLLNIIFMLIFNEILECNFWGLNKDLKKNINLRYKAENIDNSKDYSLGSESDFDTD